MKIGRNDPCPCGSGKKYKKCCINKNDFEYTDSWADFLNYLQEHPEEDVYSDLDFIDFLDESSNSLDYIPNHAEEDMGDDLDFFALEDTPPLLEIHWNTYNNIEGIYKYESNGFITSKHNHIAGQKNYVLSNLEKIIGNLKREIPDDEMTETLANSLRDVAIGGIDAYYEHIEACCVPKDRNSTINRIKKSFSHNILTHPETVLLERISNLLIADFLYKSEYENLDYRAMLVNTTVAYQIIAHGLNKYINCVDIYVGTDDKLKHYDLHYCDECNKNIFFRWHPIDIVDNLEAIYASKYPGLEPNSIFDLATAQATKEQFFTSQKNNLSYGILVKQYSGIVEQEINALIKMQESETSPRKHLMWAALIDYIEKNDIKISGINLLEILKRLHPIRNKAAHGEWIFEDEYNIIKECVDHQLFDFISWEKLRIKNNNNDDSLDNLSLTNSSTKSLDTPSRTEELITQIFYDLKLYKHKKECEYLRYIILRLLENKNLLCNLKELYLLTAQAFDTDPSHVERTIKHAIKLVWSDENSDNISNVFGCVVLGKRGNPSNSEFLAMITDKILLNLSA